jgi:hypothetical protein
MLKVEGGGSTRPRGNLGVLSKKGTAMKKSAKESSPDQASIWTQLLIPLAALVRGDLLALVHQLGLQAIVAMLEDERTKLCGERYKHDASRAATRGGSTHGDLALGGRRVTLRRPRVVDRKGREVPLETWEQFASKDALDVRALEQMAVGVATRKYARSLESLPEDIATRGTSKSAVSRRFVAITTEKLAEWMGRSLAALDVWAVCDGERGRMQDNAGGPRGSRTQDKPLATVRYRWKQSAALGHPQPVRSASVGAAMPGTQDSQRARPSSQRKA